MPHTRAVVTATDLHKSYGSVQAVRGVSFEVGKGEVFGLLGPNGAGKTTILEMIEGMLPMDRGSATVDGIDV
ncbi:MAG TPA: ATP-binding cassette domain-containing protein, partial [Patescibacteria group bacterium]|nr:ATP-binding cassette domain-containing protein [Patescibacteria group bacterium]